MRYITNDVLCDLKKKMVFIGGPRQVGKTTLARAILDKDFSSRGAYFNWDFDEDRRAILDKQWSEGHELLVFDELHKFPRWKQWIKGIYDVLGKHHAILVTGSARLDLYRRGGDSLLGRYHYWRLHPFTLDEVPEGMDRKEALRRLMTVGGFPEPFFEADERMARRWRRERFERILREDIREIEYIRNIQTLGLLVDMLRKRVGSPIVISNIARDLEVAHQTIKHWLMVLERMYLIFIVWPYAKSGARAISKPPKVYFFDNADVIGDEGARFENLVATSLLKRCHFWEDKYGYRVELCYIRDKERREVDFAILKDGKLISLIEAKYSQDKISRGLRYYARRLSPKEAVQVVASLRRAFDKEGIRVMGPLDYFITANSMRPSHSSPMKG